MCGNLGKDLENFSYKKSGLARACIISRKRTAKDHCKALFTRAYRILSRFVQKSVDKGNHEIRGRSFEYWNFFFDFPFSCKILNHDSTIEIQRFAVEPPVEYTRNAQLWNWRQWNWLSISSLLMFIDVTSLGFGEFKWLFISSFVMFIDVTRISLYYTPLLKLLFLVPALIQCFESNSFMSWTEGKVCSIIITKKIYTWQIKQLHSLTFWITQI